MFLINAGILEYPGGIVNVTHGDRFGHLGPLDDKPATTPDT
ncbi:hypothetical protein [Microvirga makkahensis]|nr:hypothetical protein [Microvirga makkahensis]